MSVCTPPLRLANAEGHEAYHVVHIGMTGAKDWQIIQTIIAEDYTFVTNNASDFRALYQAEDLHAGLVIIVPQVRPEIQRQLFQAALEDLGADELIGNEVEVDLDDGVALFQRYPMPQD